MEAFLFKMLKADFKHENKDGGKRNPHLKYLMQKRVSENIYISFWIHLDELNLKMVQWRSRYLNKHMASEFDQHTTRQWSTTAPQQKVQVVFPGSILCTVCMFFLCLYRFPQATKAQYKDMLAGWIANSKITHRCECACACCLSMLAVSRKYLWAPLPSEHQNRLQPSVTRSGVEKHTGWYQQRGNWKIVSSFGLFFSSVNSKIFVL